MQYRNQYFLTLPIYLSLFLTISNIKQKYYVFMFIMYNCSNNSNNTHPPKNCMNYDWNFLKPKNPFIYFIFKLNSQTILILFLKIKAPNSSITLISYD